MAFDPQAATEAYINSLGPEALALARAYTSGNHWLILAGLVVSALMTLVIVRSRVLEALHTRLTARGPNLRAAVLGGATLALSTLIALPYDIYTGWWRETQYGRSSQPFGDYLGQSAISFTISTIAFALFFVGVYFLLRRAGRAWWLWAGGLVAGALAFVLLLSPVVIEPLFNEYRPIPEGEVRDAVLAMAAEANIPEDRIFVFDGSRQSNNFTANVSGIGGSARIAISDVALGDASLDEVTAVTGHEIGHYALGHVWRQVIVLSLVAVAVFGLVARFYAPLARAFGTSAGIDDPRGLPVFLFAFGLFMTLANPITNTLSRMGETEADDYSLRTVNQPDGLASALIKTAEYRYPLAGPVEEAIFYTHPTVANRVRRAMKWKAANPLKKP
jgi:STE24 endopeptidase